MKSLFLSTVRAGYQAMSRAGFYSAWLHSYGLRLNLRKNNVQFKVLCAKNHTDIYIKNILSWYCLFINGPGI